MLKRFCLTVCLIFLSISVQGKVLDIIIGGDIGQGLQCKEDSNCPSGEYCHQEQYYCVACKVPPYEWTGTTCQCPEGTVEKDGKNCVECLLDMDCKTDYNCDTDTNHCEYCKFPKLWVNNQCICPSGTREQAGVCVCIKGNTELDNKTGRCVCILNEDKCGDVNFNEEECACCPADKPLYMAQMCRTCASVYPDRPIWNGTLKECVQCQTNKDCKGTTPVCELNTHTCAECPDDKPFWDEWFDRCVQCRTNADCSGTTPVCNVSTHVCEECPVDRPTWDASTNQCVKYVTVTWRNASNTNTQSVKNNQDIFSQNPSGIEGYTFDGWYWDAGLTSRVNFPVRVDTDTTFYAKWNSTGQTLQEIPINKCGGSRLGSEYTYKEWTHWVPKGAIVEAYAQSAWNNDGYNCTNKTANWRFDFTNGDYITHGGWEFDAIGSKQCYWMRLSDWAPNNFIRIAGNADWSKYCDVVMRIRIRYRMPDITY